LKNCAYMDGNINSLFSLINHLQSYLSNTRSLTVEVIHENFKLLIELQFSILRKFKLITHLIWILYFFSFLTTHNQTNNFHKILFIKIWVGKFYHAHYHKGNFVRKFLTVYIHTFCLIDILRFSIQKLTV
jgi:hypothetical protein